MTLAPWALGAVLIAYAWFSGGYLVTVMSFALIYAIFVTGLNVFMGFAGQVSFGQNAFAAISGYTSAVLTTAYGMEPLVGMAIGIGGALAFALLIGTLVGAQGYQRVDFNALSNYEYELPDPFDPTPRTLLPTDGLSPLFQAVLEATEEAVYNALFQAETMSGNGATVDALPLDRVRELLRR